MKKKIVMMILQDKRRRKGRKEEQKDKRAKKTKNCLVRIKVNKTVIKNVHQCVNDYAFIYNRHIIILGLSLRYLHP